MDKEKKVINGITFFTKEFKLKVIKEVEQGLITKEEARRKYDIKGKSAILIWQRAFKRVPQTPMKAIKMVLKKERKEKNQDKIPSQKRIKELEKQLEDEKLKSLVYSTMIDIAEKELKISIRKKYYTKPSTK